MTIDCLSSNKLDPTDCYAYILKSSYLWVSLHQQSLFGMTAQVNKYMPTCFSQVNQYPVLFKESDPLQAISSTNIFKIAGALMKLSYVRNQ